MDKEKSKRVYERLEKALLEENSTYEEAENAVNKLREVYFNRKAGNFLKNVSIKEIASGTPSSCAHTKTLSYENGRPIFK